MNNEPCTCKEGNDLLFMSHTNCKHSERNKLIESRANFSDQAFVNLLEVLTHPDAFNPLPVSIPNPVSNETKDGTGRDNQAPSGGITKKPPDVQLQILSEASTSDCGQVQNTKTDKVLDTVSFISIVSSALCDRLPHSNRPMLERAEFFEAVGPTVTRFH